MGILRLLATFCFIALGYTGFSQGSYWQQKIDYRIDVKLVDAENALEGFEKLDYYNNSPDSLNFIWFHIWPNAYKNDKTAFSEQLLKNGRKDFYFSEEKEKGYINRLNFQLNGASLETEAHPLHIDIIKVLLPKPIAPGGSITISTPFYVKLPKYFSRSGHIGKFFMVTQWYP